MIELDGNVSGDQTFVVTAQEARQWTTGNFTHYLFEAICDASDKAYYWIADCPIDNERFTQVQIDITVNDPTAGNVVIAERGLFRYTIYGQTSSTNLDPTDASVVGELETGVMRIKGEVAYDFPTLDTPDSYIYYE